MMKKTITLLLLTFFFYSCVGQDYEKLDEDFIKIQKDLEITNEKIKSLEIKNDKLKKENDYLLSKIDILQETNNINKKTLKDYIESTSEEDIKLSGCKEIKEISGVKWCKSDSRLVKNVEGYPENFSNSIQNDTGSKGIYKNDDDNTFYTYNYLEKACGFVEDEGIKTIGHGSQNCPCPIGYHIPTSKEFKQTINSYDAVENFINDFGVSMAGYRNTSGSYKGGPEFLKEYLSGKYMGNNKVFTTYITNQEKDNNVSIMIIVWKKVNYTTTQMFAKVGRFKYEYSDVFFDKNTAMPLRCIQD